MERNPSRTALVLLGLALVAAPSLYASMVVKMDLAGLVGRADGIYRGTVESATEGSIQAGGGELSTINYRIRVHEVFKGNNYLTKGDETYAEIAIVVPPKRPDQGNVRAFSKLPDPPQLSPGQEYLLITTAPSSAGLSTTVGVGQGAFKIFFVDKTEMAVNELNNQGLYDGPVAYSQLANDILALLGQ